MKRAQLILLSFCIWMMLALPPARASDVFEPTAGAGADDRVDHRAKLPVAIPRRKAVRVNSRVGTSGLSADPIQLKSAGHDVPVQRSKADPSKRPEPGTDQVPDHPAGVITAPTTTILPGLPSPMVAMVDPADLARSHPQTASARPKAAGEQAASGLQAAELPLNPVIVGSPVSIAASIIPAEQGAGGGLLLPFDRHVGAAAFRRKNLLVVVFDSSKPVDLSPVSDDPSFGAASYSLLTSGAMMTLPVQADTDFELVRKPGGWLLRIATPAHPTAPLRPDARMDSMTLSVADPGQVVVMNDPVLKVDLLVGTVRQDRQNMPVSWHSPSYILGQTILGAVVERLTDRLEMRATSNSFLIEQLDGGTLSKGSPPLVDRMFFSRMLDLPSIGDVELERRYKTALAAAAAAPVANRRSPRLAAAEAALALGQGREAGLLAAIADKDAPAGSRLGRSIFLRAAAAVLDHSPEALTLLEDPRVVSNDEVTLWRALDLAQREAGNADAAQTLFKYIPLIKSYPVRLRERLLGEAAMSLASAGGSREAARVLSLEGDGKVKLAQAMVLLRGAVPTRALAVLDPLSADADPAIAFAAAEKAVELRLQQGQITPREAADHLDAQILGARMAGEELPLKLRIAALRAQTANWPAALASLREIATSFPTAATQVAHASADILERMAGRGASTQVPPDIAQLGMIENNLDLLQADADRTKVSIALAQRLVELDLPDRAALLVQDAVARTAPGVERARLGLELAELRVDQADAAGTLAALDTTVVPDLPVELANARAMVHARADAIAGRTENALATLAPLQGPEADDLRASELAARQDWRGEAAAVASLVAHQVPASGKLSAASEDLVLRLVAATARSGNEGALRQLEPQWEGRFSTPAKLAMLRLLTSDSVKGEADLARSGAELPVSQSALSALSAAPASSGG